MKKTIFDSASVASEKTKKTAEEDKKYYFKNVRDRVKEEIDGSIRRHIPQTFFDVPTEYAKEFKIAVGAELAAQGYSVYQGSRNQISNTISFEIAWRQ